MIKEIKKLYKFMGLTETNEKEAKNYNNDYDDIKTFEEKITSILTTKELTELKNGKTFQSLAVYGLYKCYSDSGILLYTSSEEVKKEYIEYGVDLEYINNDMKFCQMCYDTFEN